MTDPNGPTHDPTADTTVHRVDDAASVNETTAAPIATPIPAASSSVPTTPVAKPRGRMRWLVAGLAVALVVGVSAFATLSLTGSSPSATVLGYAPADSVAYGEARLDLPGDQARMLGEFLSHFPGFADQAALETKIKEILDQLVSKGTDGEQSFTGDIEPWFEGELAFSFGPPPAAAGSDPQTTLANIRAMLLVSIKDEALARAWFEQAFSEAGIVGTTQDYQGTTLTVYDDTDMGAEAAFAIIDGKVAVAGDLTSVKAAVDSNGASGLATDAEFAAAMAATEGDSVGFMFVDVRVFMDAMIELSESMGPEVPIGQELLAMVPDWMGFRLRIEGDAIVMDSALSHVDAAPGPSENRANGVAAFAPETTILLAAGNDYGATLQETVELYRDEPTMRDVLDQLDQALGVLGGREAVLDWMGDTGLVVAQAGDSVEGGLVSIPTDAEDAEQFLTTVRSLVALGGGQAGIEVREEDYAGTTITIIDLGSAQELLGMAGAMGGVPLDPDSAPALPEGEVEISFAATDDVVVIGSGPNFVKSVLDAGAGSSLGDTSRYSYLVAATAADHTAVTFVDIAAMRTLAEGFLEEATAEERAEYEESIKPFLEPLDAFVATTEVGAEIDEQHARLTVK
jgi:hypothetical protein